MESSSSPPLPSSSPPSTGSTSSADATDPSAELETSQPDYSEDFIGDALRAFRVFLLGVPALQSLAARMGTAARLPQAASLAALRALTSDVTLAILVGEPKERDEAAAALVVRLAAENNVSLSTLSAGEQARIERWIALFASYFADLEIA
jgi:hypothetical protein